MKKWWKSLGWLAGGLISLGMTAAPASAQFPPSGEGYGPPGAYGNGPPSGPPPQEPPCPPSSLKEDGAPNAFSDMYGVRAQPRGFGSLPPGPLQNYLSHLVGHPPRPGVPANFPNPCQPSCEEASPFTVQPGGATNGFTELYDPNPPGWFHRPRLLFTELLNSPCPVAPYTMYFRSEYLRWHLTNPSLAAPLVTTTANFPAEVGALGQPNTQILVPDGNINSGSSNGFRLTLGVAIGYIPPIEITGFYVRNNTTVFSGGSLTSPNQVLAVPFQDVQTAFLIPGLNNVGVESAEVIAAPSSVLGLLGGTISITSQVTFYNIEANVFLPLLESDVLKVEGSLGYRHLQMNESLNINTTSGGPFGSIFFLGNPLPQGQFTNSTFDSFSTQNRFDGGQLGLRGTLVGARWSLITEAKLALGVTNQTLNINGFSTLNQTVGNRTSESAAGGIFALPSNSGTFASNGLFTVIPEMNFALSYRLSPNVRLFGGYNFLLWSKVARAGDFINPVIDSRQIPTNANYVAGITYNGPTPPTSLTHRDFIAQGVFLGVEFGF